jgi:hypothetical protein
MRTPRAMPHRHAAGVPAMPGNAAADRCGGDPVAATQRAATASSCALSGDSRIAAPICDARHVAASRGIQGGTMSTRSTRFMRCGAILLAGLLLAGCSTSATQVADAPAASATQDAAPPVDAAIAGASSGTSPAGAGSPAATTAPSQDALDPAACAARGGTIRPLGGRLQKLACVVPYTDAGKVCHDRSDCEGRCQATGTDATGAATGICQRDATTSFGCHGWIENGKAQTICID